MKGSHRGAFHFAETYQAYFSLRDQHAEKN